MTDNDEIGQSEECVELGGVFGQPAVADLPMFEEILDDVEGMFDQSPNLRFASFPFPERGLVKTFWQGFDPAPLGGNQPFGLPGEIAHLRALLHSLVSGVTVNALLRAMQKAATLTHVGDVGRRAHDAVNQPRLDINSHVGLHAEIPLIALARLMHLRIAFAFPILRRGRCGNDRGIDDGAFSKAEFAFL